MEKDGKEEKKKMEDKEKREGNEQNNLNIYHTSIKYTYNLLNNLSLTCQCSIGDLVVNLVEESSTPVSNHVENRPVKDTDKCMCMTRSRAD